MKLLKVLGIIVLIPVALLFFPVTICLALAYIVWKNRRIHSTKLRYSLIACFLLLTIFFGSAEIAGIANSKPTQQTAQTQTVKKTAQVQAPKPTLKPLSYKIMHTQEDYTPSKELVDQTLYAMEDPVYPFNKDQVTKLLNTIKGKECKTDYCSIELFDDAHYLDENYIFDTWPENKDTSLFDKQYPDFEKTDEHHMLASYMSGTYLYYPLIAMKNVTITPYDYSKLTPTVSKSTSTPAQTPQSNGNALYPNSALTPGEAFNNVTAAQVCTSGYSASVRNVPTTEKEQVFAEYGIPYSEHANYEVDHLISLELGGDNSIKNLWPEYDGGVIPNPKDKVENYLHSQVCNGNLSLAEAQNEIKIDWYKVYLAIGGSTTASTTTTNTSAPVQSSTTTTNTVSTNTSSVQPGQATGKCNDGTETYAVNHQGACSHHEGVAEWY